MTADRFKPAAGGHFVLAVHLRGRGFRDRVGDRPALERPLAPISIGSFDWGKYSKGEENKQERGSKPEAKAVGLKEQSPTGYC
jgi:hypothetical protein